jgi:hypothetical protein
MRNQRKCKVDSLAKTSERVEVFGKIEGRAPALREWSSEGQPLVSCPETDCGWMRRNASFEGSNGKAGGPGIGIRQDEKAAPEN